MIDALVSLLAAGVVSFLLTPLTGRLAVRFGIIDHPSQNPEGHKQHASPTPYLGGLAIFGGLLVGSVLALVTTEGIPLKHFYVTIGAGLGLGLIGLLDDISPLPRSLRLAVQIVVSVIAWGYGFGISSVEYPFDLILTILWIVGITNAFNLLDNIDGASAGLAGIASLAFAAMAILNELPLLPVVAAAVAGSAFGFLVHNRHPAKVFMGDAGSLFLGFLVALLGLRLRFENSQEATFLVPVVVLGMPIVDTTIVVISRLRSRRPIFLGARDHISHRLVRMGLSPRTAVRLMYVAAACLAWLGITISEAPLQVAFMLLGFILGMGLFLALILLRVPVEPARSTTELAPATSALTQLGQESVAEPFESKG